MAVIAVLAFALAIMGCANPQEKERAGGSGGEKATRPAQEAKPSRKDAAGAPSPPSAEKALSMLEGLAVGPSGSMAGYSRDEFPHWASEAERYGWKEPDGSCDVRDLALIRDGKGVEIDGECSITAGTWLDPYTGRTMDDPSEVDIDHVVPLANAWRSGAGSAGWSDADREAYANDPEVLLSADAGANREKGDKGPEAWKPPNHDYWCEYARRWIWIKSDWHLTVNPAEKSSLRKILGTCGEG
jgi:5-methylcytosine-specific restriction endonuclease McrA